VDFIFNSMRVRRIAEYWVWMYPAGRTM